MGQGAYISGIAHAALIVWALVGGLFLRADDPLPIETMDVSVLTPEEFDQLFAVSQADLEPAPEPEPTPAPEPEPTPEPEPAPVPEPLPEPDPVPQPPAPEPVVPEPELPVSETPTPQQADIISTEVTPAPEPEAAPLPDAATQTAPDEQAEPETVEAEAAAPEATTTEIVTEAETPSTAAPTRSMLPAARPSFEVAEVQPEPEPTPEPAPEEPPQTDPIAEALAQATAETQTNAPSPTPRGPPLSRGEKDALRVSVQRCWNVGSLSSEALQTTVTVFVEMQPDGRPIAGSLRMIDFQGGSQSAATKAYEAARRAIIRCGSSGFDLPREKYSQWAEIEMIFNPEQMRIK